MKLLLLPLTLSSLAAILCYLTAGNSLDLFLGGLLLTTLLSTQLHPTYTTFFALTLPVSLTWYLPVHANMITLYQWTRCVLILLTFLATTSLTTRLLVSLVSTTLATTLTTTLALAWLTFPIWLSPYLPGFSLHYSILFHPLFTLNHELIDLGIWTEQQGAYNLTNLGQDVSYNLPFSTWPTIAFCTAIVFLLTTSINLRAKTARGGHAV